VCCARTDANMRIFVATTPESQLTPLTPEIAGNNGLLVGMVPSARYWASTQKDAKDTPKDEAMQIGWDRPVVAVAQWIAAKFPKYPDGTRRHLRGGDICIASNVPTHSSLRSCEAIAVAAVLALAEVNELLDEPMLEPGVPLAEFVANALAKYDSTQGDFWYDEQLAFGLCNAGAMCASSAITGAICKFDHGTQYRESATYPAYLPEGYQVVIAACGNDPRGAAREELNRAKARAAHVAWQSGARRTTERNLAEAYEMGLTPATMAKAVRFHFRSGGQDRDPLPGELPLQSHVIQTLMPKGESFSEEQLINRVLDFGLEQLAADDLYEAVKNLAVNQGHGEEHALSKVVKGCYERVKTQMEAESPEVAFLVYKARECGALAAGAAGHGAAWALIKTSRKADALGFEASWRHMHATQFEVPCDIFITAPTGKAVQYERGNYFD